MTLPSNVIVYYIILHEVSPTRVDKINKVLHFNIFVCLLLPDPMRKLLLKLKFISYH